MHGKLHYSIKTYYNVEMSTDINKDLLKQKKKNKPGVNFTLKL